MRLSENRMIAWIVLAVAVAFALSLSGNALEKNALEMRDDVLQQKQTQYAAPESDHGRGEGETPHPGDLFNGRDQQAPH